MTNTCNNFDKYMWQLWKIHVTTLTNTCNNFDKYIQQLWQIHATTLTNSCNNFGNLKIQFTEGPNLFHQMCLQLMCLPNSARLYTITHGLTNSLITIIFFVKKKSHSYAWWAIMSMVFAKRLLEFKTQLCEECVHVFNYSFSPLPHDCVPFYEGSIFFFATFSDGICTVFPAQKVNTIARSEVVLVPVWGKKSLKRH